MAENVETDDVIEDTPVDNQFQVVVSKNQKKNKQKQIN
jgi:hypothetical protein